MTRTNPELIAALEPLLDHALELEPAELEAWLTQLRSGQPEYAAELERLLAAERELDRQGFLKRNGGGNPGVTRSRRLRREGTSPVV